VEKWIKELPRSRIAYPSGGSDRLKYWIWRFYTPLHPVVRDASTRLGIITHEGRQDYLLGSLAPKRSLRDFISFLISRGFGNHFIAWKDQGELVSLRRTVGFRYQYHVRIFTDGEVRCHYEYTPEYRPLRHMIQVGFEDRTAEFRELAQDWIVPTTTKRAE
jgi:hypothetical protein